MTLKLIVVILLVGLVCANQPDDRVIDQALSDEPKGSPDYDHEAFLGSDKAEEFKNLDPEESRRRLGIIADNIDKDKNSKITQEELEDWITFTHDRYTKEDSDRQFNTYDKNKDDLIEWDEYKTVSYGFLKDEDSEDGSNNQYKHLIERDQRRWAAADDNGDNSLTRTEFAFYIHPEEFVHMGDIVVQETLEDIDKDNDGNIDLNEYIGDMYNAEEGGEEPEWVATEKKHFKELRDLNGDGKLDLKEVKLWILPETHVDHAHVEAKHLIAEADENKDGELDKDEILAHHETFVGSQATDFGEALARHDEF